MTDHEIIEHHDKIKQYEKDSIIVVIIFSIVILINFMIILKILILLWGKYGKSYNWSMIQNNPV